MGELHKQRNNAVRVAKPASVGEHASTQSLASAWRSVEKNPAASGVMASGVMASGVMASGVMAGGGAGV